MSSNFMYLKTSSACSMLRSLFNLHPGYTAVAFSNIEGKQYLSNVPYAEDSQQHPQVAKCFS